MYLKDGWEGHIDALGEIFATVDLTTLVVEFDRRESRYEDLAERLSALKTSTDGTFAVNSKAKRLTYGNDELTLTIRHQAGKVSIEHAEESGLGLGQWARALDLGWRKPSPMLFHSN